MRKEYTCQIYYALKAFIVYIPILLTVWGIIFLLVRFVHIPPSFGAILIISSMILPFLFKKKIKNIFTKRCTLKLDSNGFSIRISNLMNDFNSNELIYKWDEIKSYRFYFSSSKLTYLNIYLKNGSSKKLGFIDNKNEKESINEESVFSVFINFIQKYNANKVEDDEKITFVPGPLITLTGLIILYVFGLFIVTDIILYIANYKLNAGFLIMSIFTLLALLAQRNQQLKFYERMKKLQ
jgi:hypothetical protein